MIAQAMPLSGERLFDVAPPEADHLAGLDARHDEAVSDPVPDGAVAHAGLLRGLANGDVRFVG